MGGKELPAASMAWRDTIMGEGSLPREDLSDQCGARLECWLKPSDFRDEAGLERYRTLSAVRAYCLKVLGRDPDEALIYKEWGRGRQSIYRVEVRIYHRPLVVFWVFADGEIVKFPPGKGRGNWNR